MDFIIGGNGLTGSALVRSAKIRKRDYKIIQKENKNDFINTSCDVLFFANGNASKYIANNNPFFDFQASVESIVEYIHKINFKKLVFLSSVDVYDKKFNHESTAENSKINIKNLDVYGYNKYLAESYVKNYCDDYIIFRLPGLVGPGLKKNPAFDFINPEKNVMISSESKLNFIHTDFMAESIFGMIDLKFKNEIFNLASKNSLKIGDLEKIVGFNSSYTDNSKDIIQTYDINTEKISKHLDLSTSEEAIKAYFSSL